FIEHMLFKGTAKRTAYDVARVIDSIGGYTDAFTSKEETCFYAKMLDEHLSIVMELFSDILIHPKFDPEDIDRERKVIFEEIKMVEDTPGDLVHEIFLENFWAGHPLGRPILGSVETVRNAGQKELRDCFSAHYQPPNMVVAAAGNIEHATLIELLSQYFGTGASRPPSRGADQTRPRANSVALLRSKKDLEQAHLCLGMPAYDCRHPDRYAAAVMNVILGGSMSSRLFQKIREERGLCYTVYSSLSAFEDAGYMSIYAGTGKDTVKEATELIFQECRAMAKDVVQEDELENAKNHLKGSLMLGLESSSNRMFDLAKNDIHHGRQIPPEEVLERVSAVTLEDVRRISTDLFVGSEYGIVVVGDLDKLDFRVDDFR
ncbi:MAG TPA: pitrilysin family protein, partial [Acidobacteriota bacterium]|nr:pitrilysin family protein [Acidobacteriota bacterium]